MSRIIKKMRSKTIYEGWSSIILGLVGFPVSAYIFLACEFESEVVMWFARLAPAVLGAVFIFVGWIWIVSAKLKIGKCFLGLLSLPEPPQPLQNDIEKYAFLVDGFYEVSQIIHDDKESLEELSKDPNHRRKASVDYSDHLALNDFKGIYNKATSTIPTLIENAWDVTDNESAIESISTLWGNARESAEIPLVAYENWEDYAEALVELGFNIEGLDPNQINIAGFDIVRTIWLARNSYVSGYISEDDLRSITYNVATFVAANYESWKTLAYSYLMSYLSWLVHAKPNLAYHMLVERVYAVQTYITADNSPLNGTSLDDLRAYLDKFIEEMEANTEDKTV